MEKSSGKALRLDESFYREIFENVSDIIFIHDLNGTIIHTNPALRAILGYECHEVAGQPLAEYVALPFRKELAVYLDALKSRGQATGIVRMVTRGGDERFLSYNSAVFGDNPHLCRGIARDITVDYLAARVLEETQERLERLVANLPGIVYRCVNDAYCTMYYLSDYVEKVLGYSPAEIVENRSVAFIDLVHEEDREPLVSEINARLAEKQPYFVDYRMRHRLGQTVYVCEVGRGVFSGTELRYREGVILDITDRKRAEEQLKKQHAELIQLHSRVHHLSITDTLTGLFNRYYFEQVLERLVADEEAYPLSLLVVDVDGLKVINDTLGHQQGDSVLRIVGAILREPFRVDDVVARIGGDEFAIILPRTGREVVEQAKYRILEGVSRENRQLDDLRLSISLGHVTVDRPGPGVAEIVKKADDAMYSEKFSETSEARQGIVKSLLATLEVRDHMTAEHAERLQRLALKFGQAAGLSRREIDDLLLLTLLHDIGKIGVPDSVLFKPGPLSSEERCLMQKHTEIGYRIAAATPELTAIARYVLLHHERWDGNGYPKKLQGKRIPLICRVLSILDAYDAMTSDRPYRRGLGHKEATAELLRCAGSQFDPDLVELFVNKVLPEAIKV